MEECYYEEAEINGSRCAALGGFSPEELLEKLAA